MKNIRHLFDITIVFWRIIRVVLIIQIMMILYSKSIISINSIIKSIIRIITKIISIFWFIKITRIINTVKIVISKKCLKCVSSAFITYHGTIPVPKSSHCLSGNHPQRYFDSWWKCLKRQQRRCTGTWIHAESRAGTAGSFVVFVFGVKVINDWKNKSFQAN